MCTLAETARQRGPAIVLGDLNETWSSDLMLPLRELRWIDTARWEASRSRGPKARVPGTYWKRRHTRLDFLLVSPELESMLHPGSAKTHSGGAGTACLRSYPVTVDLALPGSNAIG